MRRIKTNLKALRWTLAFVGLMGLLIWLMPAQLTWAIDRVTVNPPSGQPGNSCLCLELTIHLSNPNLVWVRVTSVEFRPPDGIRVIGWTKEAIPRDGKAVITVCIELSENATPGERAVTVTYDGYDGTERAFQYDQRGRGSFTVGDIPLPPNTGHECAVPPGAPGSPDRPPPSDEDWPWPELCSCELTLVLVEARPDLTSTTIEVKLRLWFDGYNADAYAYLYESEQVLIIMKPPQGPETKAFVLRADGKGDIREGPCPNGQIVLTLRLDLWTPQNSPDDDPLVRRVIEFLEREVPQDWQVAPGQWLTSQGWRLPATIDTNCPFSDFYVLDDIFVAAGRFRLIREGDRLRVEPEGPLEIDFSFSPHAGQSSSLEWPALGALVIARRRQFIGGEPRCVSES